MTEQQIKKRETLILLVLALLLALIIMISKFVLGINFKFLEQGYQSFGYHEIRDEQIWALSFDSFSGSVSAEGHFSADSPHELVIYSGAQNSGMELEVATGQESNVYILNGSALEMTLPEDQSDFTLTLSGTDVLSGFFSAIWK